MSLWKQAQALLHTGTGWSTLWAAQGLHLLPLEQKVLTLVEEQEAGAKGKRQVQATRGRGKSSRRRSASWEGA